jgi:hypothetical protein
VIATCPSPYNLPLHAPSSDCWAPRLEGNSKVDHREGNEDEEVNGAIGKHRWRGRWRKESTEDERGDGKDQTYARSITARRIQTGLLVTSTDQKREPESKGAEEPRQSQTHAFAIKNPCSR